MSCRNSFPATAHLSQPALWGDLWEIRTMALGKRAAQRGKGRPPGEVSRKVRWLPHSFLRALYPKFPRLESRRPRRDHHTDPIMQMERNRDRRARRHEPNSHQNTDARGRHPKHGLAYYITQARDLTDRDVPLEEIRDAHEAGRDPRVLWGDVDE